MESLLFHFLDEFLFLFSAEPYFIPKVEREEDRQVELSCEAIAVLWIFLPNRG